MESAFERKRHGKLRQESRCARALDDSPRELVAPPPPAARACIATVLQCTRVAADRDAPSRARTERRGRTDRPRRQRL
jgi:hypothetical protein